jgi:uncharacterized protein (DUF58 family)
LLPRELIRKVRRIEIRTRRLVNDMLAGQYQSVFKGRGMAFDEVRQYQAGDDIRLIDWNVSARLNEAFVKVFVEERELTVMLAVDMSHSGLFGTREQRKRELAAEIAALLAFSAIKNNDRVGLIIFTDKVEKFVPPKKGRKHVLRVVTEILNYRPLSRRTSLETALGFLGTVSRRKAVAFVISDFIDQGYEHSLKVAAKRHDLIPVCVADPMEEELPALGLVTVEDPETGELATIHTSPALRRAYHLRVARQREMRESLFRRLKLDFIDVRTDKPYISPLVQFFESRGRRGRR